MTANDDRDRELAASALQKRAAGKNPNRQEEAALRRVEKRRAERLADEAYRAVPLKKWREWSGRQTRQIKDQAALYGLPMDGPTIDLADFVAAFFEFLGRNAVKLASPEVEGDGPALERLREEQYLLRQMDRRQRAGELLDRQEVRERFGRVAALLRAAGDKLQRLPHDGRDAFDIFCQALDQAVEEVAELTETPPE